MVSVIRAICSMVPGVTAFILFAMITEIQAEWWSMGSSDTSLELVADLNVPCSEITSLSRSQRTLCERYRDHLKFVGQGAELGINECQWQFRSHRWNCSTTENKRREVDLNASTLFGKVIDIGSRETAFTYAISAAGVVHKIARACKEGNLGACSCSSQPRPDGLGPTWEWGGCGDNTEYAYGFAREFIDAKERDVASPRTSSVRAKKAMNLHNNEVGRLAVVRSARPICKCHGVSGSCSLNSCWLQTAQFREIGKELQAKHGNAVEIRVNSRGRIKNRRKDGEAPTVADLVFLDSSPDYCRPNPRTGVLGTKGRYCSKDSHGPDACGLLCCGRGYHTFTEEVVERCHCKFQWCCFVRCQKCRKRVKRHVCR